MADAKTREEAARAWASAIEAADSSLTSKPGENLKEMPSAAKAVPRKVFGSQVRLSFAAFGASSDGASAEETDQSSLMSEACASKRQKKTKRGLETSVEVNDLLTNFAKNPCVVCPPQTIRVNRKKRQTFAMFSSRGKLKQHVADAHATSRFLFRCEVCDGISESPAGLMKHMEHCAFQHCDNVKSDVDENEIEEDGIYASVQPEEDIEEIECNKNVSSQPFDEHGSANSSLASFETAPEEQSPDSAASTGHQSDAEYEDAIATDFEINRPSSSKVTQNHNRNRGLYEMPDVVLRTSRKCAK